MKQFATTCEAIAGTTKKLQKTAIVADYLKSTSRGRGRSFRSIFFRDDRSLSGRKQLCRSVVAPCGGLLLTWREKVMQT